jgi:acetylornithine deacetylase
MGESLSALEETVVAAVRAQRDELVALTRELVAYDTTARVVGAPARDEERLQRSLAARLKAIGAEIDLWEPPATGRGNRLLPDDLDFTGRPQLAARLGGGGGGRSLLLNGHIDAVSVEPRANWTYDPFAGEIHDGRLYGRGAADMKGGIAAIVVALEALHGLGVQLAGDVIVCTVTDEESSGAGGWAAVDRGVRADAGICAEPTGFDAWVACRGTVCPTITIPGRAGHAEAPQPDWREGGAVNAIEKLPLVLEALAALRAEWSARADHQHPLLAAGDIVPTIVHGGDWSVTIPAWCDLHCDAMFLPAGIGAATDASVIENEIRERVDAFVRARDPWFEEHPLRWEWSSYVLPAEIPADHPLVTAALSAAAALGRPGKVAGLDSWHDAATFTRFGGTPCFSFGGGEMHTAHAVDEYTEIDELVDVAAAIALAALRFCGTA